MDKYAVGVNVSCGRLKVCLYGVKSFGIIVVFLKVLLNQSNLDVPGSGGLGSHKLYVLVAAHIEKHIASGGSDEAGAVLLSFLYRYGGEVGEKGVSGNEVTVLKKDTKVEAKNKASSGALFVADMSNVHKLQNIVFLFGATWKKLKKAMSRCGCDVQKVLMLDSVIDRKRLEADRQRCWKKAEDVVERKRNSEGNSRTRCRTS